MQRAISSQARWHVPRWQEAATHSTDQKAGGGVPLPTSDLGEESGIDPDIFDCASRRPDAEVVSLEQFAQAVAVDEVDRRGAVAGGFLLGVRGERARRDQKALVAPACHRAAEVADGAGADAAAGSLALKEDREADQPEPVDAEPVDPTVAALPGDVHAVEVSFTQEPPGEPLEGIGWH